MPYLSLLIRLKTITTIFLFFFLNKKKLPKLTFNSFFLKCKYMDIEVFKA